MKAETKELFDEMLTFKRRKLPPRHYMNHLLDALENCTDSNFSVTITKLLNWIKRSNRDNTLKETYEIDNENDKIRFQEFFSYCTTLNDIFVLHVNAITWQDLVSEEEKMEILDHVDENYDWKMSYRVMR